MSIKINNKKKKFSFKIGVKVMNQMPFHYFNVFFKIKRGKQIYILVYIYVCVCVYIYMINGGELSIYMMNNITIIE